MCSGTGDGNPAVNDKVIDLPSVRLLHATGVDINAKDEHGTTPLHVACSKGNLETVKPLIILRAITQASFSQ